MNKRLFKEIVIEFENVESITVPASDIKLLTFNDITTNKTLRSNDYGTIFEIDTTFTAKETKLILKPKAATAIARIQQHNDIAAIKLVYTQLEEETINVNWTGSNETNILQYVKLINDELYVIISEHTGHILDFFQSAPKQTFDGIIKEFECYRDIEDITSSLLLNEGDAVAYLTYTDKEGFTAELQIEVEGRVSIDDPETDAIYRFPKDFPEKLVNAIKQNDLSDFIVNNNNWFEVLVKITDPDGEQISISHDTWEYVINHTSKETLKANMLEYAVESIECAKIENKT